MYKLKYLILIIIVILGLGCSKREEKGGSSASNMKLSDVKANLSGKSLFMTLGGANSSSNRNDRTSNKSSTSSNSLLVLDNNSKVDYGIISNYEINIEQIRVDTTNTYAYMILFFENENSNSARNIQNLNCTIFQINLSNNDLKCLVSGLAVIGLESNMIYGVNDYHLEPFQIGSNSNIVFRSTNSEGLTSDDDLKCRSSCIYVHNLENNTTKRVSLYSYDGERFAALSDGNIIWTGMETNGVYDENATYPQQIILLDQQGKITELTNDPDEVFAGDFQIGDHKTAFWGSDHKNAVVFTRYINETVYKTFISGRTGMAIKGFDGNVYLQTFDSLYSLLPKIDKPLVEISDLWKNKKSSSDCGGYSTTCGTHFTIVNGIVFYNNYTNNSGIESYELKATRILDNSTVTLLKPDNTCKLNCYNFKFSNDQTDLAYRWYFKNNLLYVPMKDYHSNKTKIIQLDPYNIDFNSSSDQFSILDSVESYVSNNQLKDIDALNEKINLNPSVEIKHSDNDTSSVSFLFNKKMNYKDVESKISIIDNGTKSSIGYMPLWNINKLHLVIDTDNSTSTNFENNFLTSGITYKVSILGTAKDADGNTLGSDVVKYITP